MLLKDPTLSNEDEAPSSINASSFLPFVRQSYKHTYEDHSKDK